MALDAIGIVTQHVAQCLRFYEILGVKLEKMGDHDHYEGKTSSGVRILVDSVELVKGFEPDFVYERGGGVALCFRQDSPAAVDALYRRLEEAGFSGRKAPWDAFWGQRYACALDPDGHQVDLFAPL